MKRLPQLAFIALLCSMMFALGCQTSSKARQTRGSTKVDEARRLEAQGLSDEALAAFNAALQENPKLAEAEMGIGDIYRKRGDFRKAGAAYEKAAELEPSSFDAHYYLGLMRQFLGQLNDSIRAYLRALAIRPDNYDANANLASVYLQLKHPADGLPYARRATELKPSSQEAWANLAATHSLLGQYDEAVTAYRRAVELGAPPDELMLGFAEAHIKLGNFDRATNVLQTLIRKSPSSTAYERLGYTQFKQKRFDDALASFRAALSIDAGDTAALNGLGVCLMTLYVQGNRVAPAQRDQALEAWRKSLQIRAEQPRIIDLISRYQKM